MPILLFLILGLYLIGNFYIYFRGGQMLATYPTGVKVLFSLLYWACALSLIFTFVVRKSGLSLKILTFTHEVGSAWLVFTLYMALFLLSFDLVRLFYKPFAYGFHLSFAFTLCLLSYGYYNYKHPKTQEFTLSVNKPAETSTLKVVAVSDLHLGLGTGKEALNKYVDRINEQNPDLILISGDLIDNTVLPLKEERMDEELNRLKASLGVYMVPGNHEYIANIEECKDFLRSTQIHLLCDSVVTLPNGVQLIGRDDRQNHHRKPLSTLLEQADVSKPMILLDHQPYDLEKTVKGKVDLQFSGHTHRGQVWPINLLTDYLFDISYGYERREDTHLYVSSGLSLWGPPFRIGTNSELVVFNLKFK
ncbi:metallophosphoesterase [Massilibacteroides sp.]|uniref:metallophosphoesterase n=1 Tax=Massilibacteroides sp. TaxID=2034766 RepID=UPI002635F4B1|nr:metallophosphoesterase [Massilibacteroides sp.]MDD4514187.1 metallophosphoesterase [Massilibacteroides sp.]